MIRVIAAAIFACLWVTAASAQAAPSPSATPVCVYESKLYSDGALICVYRTLMLTCSLDGTRASWKPATDSRLVGVCEGSGARPHVAEASPRPRHRHGFRHPVHIDADRSAKCFAFNGKQYCE
jgi:hypothetical protein